MNKKKLSKILGTIQPFLLGGLLAIVIYSNYQYGWNALYYTILALICGFLFGAYIYQKKVDILLNELEMLAEINKTNLKMITKLFKDLQSDGIQVEMHTHEVDDSVEDIDDVIKMMEAKHEKGIN